MCVRLHSIKTTPLRSWVNMSGWLRRKTIYTPTFWHASVTWEMVYDNAQLTENTPGYTVYMSADSSSVRSLHWSNANGPTLEQFTSAGRGLRYRHITVTNLRWIRPTIHVIEALMFPNSGRGYWIAVVFSERELTFTFAICYRWSVCRLSVVCNVRALYSAGWNFRQYFFAIWYLGQWPPLTSTEKFTEIDPGEPLRLGGLNARGSEI